MHSLFTIQETYEAKWREEKTVLKQVKREFETARQHWQEEKGELLLRLQEEGNAFRQLRQEVMLLQKRRGNEQSDWQGELKRMKREEELWREERLLLEQEVEVLKEKLRSRYHRESELLAERELLVRRGKEREMEVQVRREEVRVLEREGERLMREREELTVELTRMDELVYGKRRTVKKKARRP